MENQTNNEPVIMNKWHISLKKWLKRLVALGFIYGLGWLFLPLIGVKADMVWFNHTIGRHDTIQDYYYVNIGGITYAKDKFYVLLRKPYLFNPSFGYIYSSKKLTHWTQELVKDKIYTTTSANMNLTGYDINNNVYTFNKDNLNESNYFDITNDLLPRYVSGSCYVINETFGLMSLNCDGKWQNFTFLTEIETDIVKKMSNNTIQRKVISDIININTVINSDYCNLYSERTFNEHSLAGQFCQQKLQITNINAYHILHKIIVANKLDILIDGSHTTYGDGKYVGIFYKNKQYYFIISTDGVHYEIKNAPEELTSSLAIKMFN